jgi:hypothetical protein
VDAPNSSITLTSDQVAELRRNLKEMRHNVNNLLSLIVTSIEVAQLKNGMTPRLLSIISEQTPKIADEVWKYSSTFETALTPPQQG